MIHIGVIGAGKIAQHAVMPAINLTDKAVLGGIASRSVETAKALAEEFSTSPFSSYEELLDSPEIDAVYIGLPNGLHREWTEKALSAGKHVLCEKSLALETSDADSMVRRAEEENLILIEAFMYRHHRKWDNVFELIQRGHLGNIKHIHAEFGFNFKDSEDHRWETKLGGGALFDVTCYPVNLSRFLYGEEPETVSCRAQLRRNRVDEETIIELKYSGERTALAKGSFANDLEQFVRISFESGTVYMANPFTSRDKRIQIYLESMGKKERFQISGKDHFLAEVENFCDSVSEGKILSPSENGYGNVRVLTACVQSYEKDGEVIPLSP